VIYSYINHFSINTIIKIFFFKKYFQKNQKFFHEISGNSGQKNRIFEKLEIKKMKKLRI